MAKLSIYLVFFPKKKMTQTSIKKSHRKIRHLEKTVEMLLKNKMKKPPLITSSLSTALPPELFPSNPNSLNFSLPANGKKLLGLRLWLPRHSKFIPGNNLTGRKERKILIKLIKNQILSLRAFYFLSLQILLRHLLLYFSSFPLVFLHVIPRRFFFYNFHVTTRKEIIIPRYVTINHFSIKILISFRITLFFLFLAKAAKRKNERHF